MLDVDTQEKVEDISLDVEEVVSSGKRVETAPVESERIPSEEEVDMMD